MFAACTLFASCGGSDGESSPDTEPSAAATTVSPLPTDPPATEPPATEPATTDAPPAEVPPTLDVFSADGELGVSYTNETDGPEVAIRLLDSTDWPVEVAGGDNVDGIKIFELEPDGAVFDEPVRVTRRLDVAAFETLGLGPFDIPLVTMLTQDEDGEFSVLDDLTVVRVGPDLYVSGSTTHFSPIIVSNENRMIPWGPGDGDVSSAPPLSETYMDHDEFLEVMRGILDEPPSRLVVAEDRYLSAPELYDHIHTLIEQQEAGDDETSTGAGGYGILDDDGTIIEGTPIDPRPEMPDNGAYRAERFGTSFPTIPASLLPSTSALVGDPNLTIGLTVWAPALVVDAAALNVTPPSSTTVSTAPEVRPVPTVVIGQDEDGNDIVIELEISEACAMTFHQPLDSDSASFIRWVFDAPGLDPGTTVLVTGQGEFSQFTKVLDDRTIIIEQGISSYGDYRFPSVEWEEDENSSSSITAEGSHTVDDREGEPSLTCVS